MRIYYLAMESWSQIVYDRLVAEAPPSPSATPPHEC
jgi:hypothetical protein